jgi:hypothetical protein
VYTNTYATVKQQIQQAENPTPAVANCQEAAHVDNAILLDYLTSKVVLEQPEIGSTDQYIRIDNNCTDDKMQFARPGGCEVCDDEDDKIDESDAIPTASRRTQAATELERFGLGASDVNGYQGNDGDEADADKEEEASQADD